MYRINISKDGNHFCKVVFESLPDRTEVELVFNLFTKMGFECSLWRDLRTSQPMTVDDLTM